MVKRGNAYAHQAPHHTMQNKNRPPNPNGMDRFAPAASRGACRGSSSQGPAAVASTRGPDDDDDGWEEVRGGRFRGRVRPPGAGRQQRLKRSRPEVRQRGPLLGQSAQAQQPLRQPARGTQKKPVEQQAQQPVPHRAQQSNAGRVLDIRRLPLPEPYDKHEPHPSRNERHQDEWTWPSWREWQLQNAGRKWHKPAIRKALKLRDQDPANRGTDFTDIKRQWASSGWIYALYHFSTGRWYVGQTIGRYIERAQSHWHGRRHSTDVLHNALANELTPFSYVVLPLEKIEDELYQTAGNREATRRHFRRFATPRERYWVGRLNSMWPRGFNAAYPGRPASAWVLKKWSVPEPNRMELIDEELNEVGRQVSAWLKHFRTDGAAALREMKNWDKVKLRENLDWIQANVPARERKANLIAVETAIIEELKERRACPPDRHYLKFNFSHQDASFLLLRNVLRDA